MMVRSRRRLGIACGLGLGLLGAALLRQGTPEKRTSGASDALAAPDALEAPEAPDAPDAERERPAPRAPSRDAERADASPCAPAAPCPPRVTVTLRAGARAVEVAAGELLVELERAEDEEAWLREASSSLGARLAGRAAGALRLALPDGAKSAAELEAALARISGDPRVRWAGPNAVARGTGNAAARKTTKAPWNVRALGAPEGDLGGAVTIAILDSGLAARDFVDGAGRVRARAPFLAGAAIASPADFVDGDAPDDGSGHGTHLASLLVGDPGLSRGAILVPVRVLDDDLVGTEASLILGLEHAVASGADVVNLSLAFSRGYFPSPALDRAFAAAIRAGVVVVAAAGNDGEGEVRFPAAFPGVLAVGASTIAHGSSAASLARADYSSHGPELDFLAPGGDLAADVDRDGVPDGILGTGFDPAAPDVFGPWLFAGTSQAAAHASAAAAHLLAAGTAPGEVAGRLRALARPLPGCSPGFDPGCGAGGLHLGMSMGSPAATSKGAKAPGDALAGAGVELRGRLEPSGEGRRARVWIRATDGEGRPLEGALAHARWRGAAAGLASCETDAEGVCEVTSPDLGGDLAAVSLEIAALSRPGIGVARPADVYALGEVAPFLEALAEGEAETPVWVSGEGEATTFALRSFSTSTALPPQIVLLDVGALGLLVGEEGAAGGAGFGSSSLPSPFFLLRVQLSSFATGGAGFGSSSSEALVLSSGSYFLKLSSPTLTYSTYSTYGASSTTALALEEVRFTPGPLLEAAETGGEAEASAPSASDDAGEDAAEGAGEGMSAP